MVAMGQWRGNAGHRQLGRWRVETRQDGKMFDVLKAKENLENF